MDAIKVSNINIFYRIVKKQSIKKVLTGKSQRQLTHAIKDVSFTIEKGDIVGVLGRNGSGKSTLLRTLAGIFSPDNGRVELYGHSISLLAIGVGFNKALSGRENIYLSGLLMGFTKKQIDEKLDEIIEFSELNSFIDQPVRSYSSGMYSKLSFAITAIMETDIMLIDEVLSVGDRRFKKKSYKKMKQLISTQDRTVMIVSHNSDTISKLCNKAMWLDEGHLLEFGDASKVISHYNAYMDEDGTEPTEEAEEDGHGNDSSK